MASSARIDELRKKFDENPRRYFAPLANEYRKAGDAEQAIFICQEYLPQQPGHMSGHIVYGQALYELNRQDEARAVFETALSLDPENLIALRHLGDIARLSGDTDTARVWYQRVLEADPRNEEIAQIMLSLLSVDSGSAAEAGEVRAPGSGAPTPLTNPAVATGADALSNASPFTSGSGALSADQRVDAQAAGGPDIAAAAATEGASPRESTPAPEDMRPLSPHAPREADLLDLDDFDLGGIPLSELRASSPTPVYQPAQPFDERTASGIELPPMIGANDDDASVGAAERLEISEASDDAAFTTDVSEFEVDPFAIAVTSAPRMDDSRHEPPDAPAHQSAHQSENESENESAGEATDESIDRSFGGEFDSESDAFEPGFATSAAGDASAASQDASVEPRVELATDLRLGLGSEEGTESSEVKESMPSAPAIDTSLDGLETFEAGVFVAEPEATSPIETEGFFSASASESTPPEARAATQEQEAIRDATGEHETVEASDDFTDAPLSLDDIEQPISVAAEAPVEAFVTETMAELYLEQGHLESALDIYQRLVDQRPEDPALFSRMQAVQDRIDAAAESSTHFASEADIAPARSYGGPTIREFLSALARRTPGSFGEVSEVGEVGDAPYSSHDGSADVPVADPYARDAYAGDDFSAYSGTPAPYDGIDEPFNADASFLDRAIDAPLGGALDAFDAFDQSNESGAPESDAHPAAATRETVGGSLGALFSGADAAASDTAAANMLADAFASEGPELAPLEGLPAHRAASELSLDHVFKGNTTARPNGDADGFSFDQFFADEAVDGAAETGIDAPAAAQGADDIAQFNAWLNGLKKT